MHKSDSKMQSLVSNYAGDSDAESDDDKPGGNKDVKRLVSYLGEEDGGELNQSRNISAVEGEEVEIDHEDVIKGEIGEIDFDDTFADDMKDDEHNTSGNSKWSESVRHLSVEEIQLPPEPTGRCSKHLQDKITGYLRRQFDLNSMIQNRKDFRNPSIYEKLISYMGIDELGSNYPDDVYNPHRWTEESFFENLAKVQKEDMAKREKERKTKVEFVTGTVKKSTTPATTGLAVPLQAVNLSNTDDMSKKRKSKWDVGAATIPAMAAQRPTLVSTSTSSTTNKTVISSTGSLKKPKMEN